jgi:hypothetical protein
VGWLIYKVMKHKIGVKTYSYECGDGCCDEYGKEWYVDGVCVHRSPCEDNGWLAVLNHLGIDVELVGLDENQEEIWTL